MDEAGLTSLLREHVARHSLPGAVLGVLRDGVVTIACQGVADVVTQEPVSPDTRSTTAPSSSTSTTRTTRR